MDPHRFRRSLSVRDCSRDSQPPIRLLALECVVYRRISYDRDSVWADGAFCNDGLGYAMRLQLDSCIAPTFPTLDVIARAVQLSFPFRICLNALNNAVAAVSAEATERSPPTEMSCLLR